MNTDQTILRPVFTLRARLTLAVACLLLVAISCSDDDGLGQNNFALEITDIRPDSGTVGTTVQIFSNGLASAQSDNTVYFNDTPADVLQHDRKKITARVPKGATSGPVRLQVEGRTADGPYFKILSEGPSIDAITPESGQPGTLVTITGDNFLTSSMMKTVSMERSKNDADPHPDSLQTHSFSGPIERASVIQTLPVSVLFGDKRAPLLSISSTKIIVEVPRQAVSGFITVTVGQLTVTSKDFQLHPAPVVTTANPKVGPGGTRVTISGQYFSSRPDSNEVYFNGSPAAISKADSTEIVTIVPEDATSGPIEVKTNGQTAPGPTFTVTEAPVPQIAINDINPKNGPVGTNVTITGANFGPNKSSNTITFNGAEAALQSASQSTLVVTVPQSATSGPIKVAANGQTATGLSFTVTQDPDKQLSVSDITPKQGPAGTAVTITGANFSGMPGDNIVSFNGTEAIITSVSTTQLVVDVPNGATSGPVQVHVGSQTAAGPTFTVTEAPVPQVKVDNISPKQGTVGTKITITGQNFDSSTSDNTVTFNGTKATVQSASTTTLTVTVPGGATTGAVKVQAGNQTATGPTFTVTEVPVPQVAITGISPKTGPVGTAVTISGQNFSPTKAENTVNFNGTEATVSSATKTTIKVTVPQGATNGPVKVAANGQTAEGPTFTVTEDPDKQLSINDISPKEGPAGTTVTITGANFSSTASDNTVSFNGTSATVQKASSTELTVTVPQGATTGNVKVEVNKQSAQGPTFTVTDTPVPQVRIADISPKSGPVGTPVTITGQNFSTTKTENTVTFNGTWATVQSASETTLEVIVPQGATNGPVNVAVSNQTAEGPTFSITSNAAPTITGNGSFEAEENTTEVATITASDPDGDDLTFSLSGGADQGVFSINNDSGKLTFSTVPDFEAPRDKDADNSYEVEVKASDGSVSVTKTITVDVTDIDEAPVLTGASFKANENGTQIATLDANDPEGLPLTYSLSGGADQKTLNLDQNSGTLTFTTAPDFESPADDNGDNSYLAEVTISDGSLNITKTVTVTVQNINEAPVLTGPTSFDIQENSTSAGTITATDPDGDALTFRLSNIPQGSVSINIDGNSGDLSIKDHDYENPRDINGDNTYQATLHVSDGDLTATQQLAITVTNTVEVPTINRGTLRPDNTTQAYQLNKTNTEDVYQFEPVPHGTVLNNAINFSVATSYSVDLPNSATVTGGPDGGLFSVNSINTYAIHIDGPTLDYNHSAAGNDHQYRFTVTATNAGGTTQPTTIIIPVQNPFAGGSGTAVDPYQVETLDQLQTVDQFLDGHFVQTVDIDASATAGWNGGKGFEPIGDASGSNRFTGSYNGGGFAITGLTINRPNTDNVGLFINTSGTLENVHVSGASVSGRIKSGMLAWRNDGNITNCSTTGEVYASTAQGSGGLVYSNIGTISGSYADVEVHASSSGFVGGLVGINFGDIANSYATGDVSGDNRVGGLVGHNVGGTIDKSYATGTATGSNSGGLVGSSEGSATATESYWDTQNSGQPTSAGGTGLTTAQMQGTAAQTNMTGFDFTTLWQTNAGDYPILRGVGGQ